MTAEQFRELRNFVEHLNSIFVSQEAYRKWLDFPAPYAGGLAPMSFLQRGEINKAHMILIALDSGVYV